MNEHLPGTKVAERLFGRSEGATMSEVIAATGGAQYNVLKRLKARGYKIRAVKEGGATRYHVSAPDARHKIKMSGKGQVLLPKRLREEAGLTAGATLYASVEDGKVVLSRATNSIRDILGILHRPGMRAATLKEIEDGIAAGAIEGALAGLRPRPRR